MAFAFYKQETKYTCGAASMRMALENVGIRKSEKAIVRLLGTSKRRGTRHDAYPRIAEKYKLNYVVHRNATIADLKEFHAKGFTVILCYHYAPEDIDHSAVLKDIDEDNVCLLDPWFGPDHKYPLPQFKEIWISKYDNEKSWFFAIKKP